ncbi:hypothetical protein L9F63_013481, partial [Diploptera punctata]
MARRRKGAGGSKAAAKSQSKASRKSNGVVEERHNGSLAPASVNESEESCVSQDDNSAPLSCRTPIEMCPDPSLGEPPPVANFKINSSPQHVPMVHKKFRKFRRMLESGDSQESQQNCIVTENVEPSETQVSQMPDNQGDSNVGEEFVMKDQELQITESQEVPVVWEEEVVEETVVCEGMEVELEDTRSQDNNLIVEEVESQESDYDQMVEVRDSEYSKQGGQVVGLGNEYNQEMVEVGGLLSHKLVEISNTEDSVKKMVLAVGSEDSRAEECSQDSQVSIRGVEMEIDEDDGLIKPVVADSVVNIVKNGDLDQQTVILQVPNTGNQITELKHDSDGETDENMETITIIKNCDENKPNSNEIEVKMSESTVKVIKDPKYYSESNDMDLINANIKSEFDANVGLDLNELKIESDCIPSPDGDFKIKVENKNAQKAQDDIKTTPLAMSPDNERKPIEEDSFPHLQDISDDQQLTNRSSEDDSDRKQIPAFRSRSGSTDTTGSESSSNCSSVVRRSNRIRSIGIMKQKAHNKNEPLEISVTPSEKDVIDGKIIERRDSSDCCSGTDTQSDKENAGVTKVPPPLSSPAALQGIVIPAIPGYDVDSCKPVKVKSRWRRSSELEMGGSRSSDSELAATPPTPSLSPRPMVPVASSLSPRPAAPATPNPLIRPVIPATSIPNTAVLPAEQPVCGDVNKKEIRAEKKEKDEVMEEKLRNFCRLTENEYLTERSTSKEAKRMVCDCFLTKDEIARGELGCGEDCLNRLLMIE